MAGYVSARYLWLPFSVQSGMFASFFLWMGYAIRERGLLERVRWPHYLIAQGLMIAGALLGYSNVAFVTAKASDLLLSTVVGLSGCLLMYGISVLLKKGRLLSGLGQISLTVLCTHLFSLETMGAYYTHLLNRIGLQGEVRLWAATALQILFALGTAVLLEGLLRVLLPVNRRMLQLAKARRQQAGGGMEAVWIDAGILALLALMLHMGADPWLSKCIRSCCAVSFVFLAGYRYEKERPLACLGRDAARYLLPYALAAVAQLLIPALRAGTPRGWLLGMTGADQLLTETPAVGVPGLLLPLFLICALYRGLDLLLPRPEYRAVAVICLSASGRLLGHYGYWLPWSLDIACFGLVFFWLGTLCRQYHLLRKLRDNAWMYFALTPVWAYMIRAKDLQITQRIYLTYGMTVLGAMAGALAVYQLAAYILRAMPVTAAAFGWIGRAALPLLVVHTLFSQPLQRALSVHMDAEKLPYFLSLLGIQLLAAVLIAAALRLLTRRRASSQQTNKPTNKE